MKSHQGEATFEGTFCAARDIKLFFFFSFILRPRRNHDTCHVLSCRVKQCALRRQKKVRQEENQRHMIQMQGFQNHIAVVNPDVRVCAFVLEDVCQPVLLSGRLLCCFMARRASPLSNEALEEATAESLRPRGEGGTTPSHVRTRTLYD